MGLNPKVIAGVAKKAGAFAKENQQMLMQGAGLLGRAIQNRRAKRALEVDRSKMSALANETESIAQKASSIRKSAMRGSLFNNLSNRIELGKQGTIRNLIRAGGGKQSLMANILGTSRQAAQQKGQALTQSVSSVLPQLLQQEIQADTQSLQAKGDVQQEMLEQNKAFATATRGVLSKEAATLKGGLANLMGKRKKDLSDNPNYLDLGDEVDVEE
jgi:hypothetical protein